MSGALVAKDGSKVSKGRIRPALMTAIRLIVEDGLTQAAAAQRVGMKAASLSIALRKPHVVAMRAAVKRAWLDSETSKAWRTMAYLANGAASEDVRHKSAKVFLDAAGELGGGNGDGQAGPRTLVNIVLHHALAGEQPTPNQLPGVIEHQSRRGLRPDPSNLITVGRSNAGDQ